MGEMFEERVTPEAIAGLDMGAQSGHWARSQAVLGVVETFFGEDAAMTAEARQARLVDRLARQWREAPPDHPSSSPGPPGRAARPLRLMDAVSRLPQGAVLLPGLDRDMPESVWTQLTEGGAGPGWAGRITRNTAWRVWPEAGVRPGASRNGRPCWPRRARTATASCRWPCVLRRSPTSGARKDRSCGPVAEALRHVTYLEAPNPQTEATAIALGLRQAAENGHRAALVSPDRNLTRQVAAALDRWNITPDDSAGEPLGLTAPGRFLRMVAQALWPP
jgi:ATP-dependent helicase/nuclease subunit B